MSPRAALTKHLLDGDDSILTGNFDKPVSAPPPGPPPSTTAKPVVPPENTPFDTDAT